MNINPYILLATGLFFALTYASVITFGWAQTRRNRRCLQRKEGLSKLPTMVLDPGIPNPPQYAETIALAGNHFVDTEGNPIDLKLFDAYIAVGESEEYPCINDGDLILKDDDGKIQYVFSMPDLSNFR